MKKTASIVWIFLFMVSTIGVSIHKHYCNGRLAGISLFDGASCGCDGVPVDPGCCNNEFKFYKVDNDFNVSAVEFNAGSHLPAADLSVPGAVTSPSCGYRSAHLAWKPPVQSMDRPVLFHSFLI